MTTYFFRIVMKFIFQRHRICAYCAKGNKLMIAVPRSVLGQAKGGVAIDFHWADNIQKLGDINEFFLHGDSAPERRFNYRYVAKDN